MENRVFLGSAGIIPYEQLTESQVEEIEKSPAMGRIFPNQDTALAYNYACNFKRKWSKKFDELASDKDAMKIHSLAMELYPEKFV